MESSEKKQLISYCGLYCGNCGKFQKGKCPGCHEYEEAKWCKIRTCCKENNYSSCADCNISAPRNCKNFNNIFAKFFEVFFKSDRKSSLEYIKEKGPDAYADLMICTKQMVIKKQKK